jgi:hypothetical protein
VSYAGSYLAYSRFYVASSSENGVNATPRTFFFYVIRTIPLMKGLVEALGRICFQGQSKSNCRIHRVGWLSLVANLRDTIFLSSKVWGRFTREVAWDKILYYKSFVFKYYREILLRCFKTMLSCLHSSHPSIIWCKSKPFSAGLLVELHQPQMK